MASSVGLSDSLLPGDLAADAVRVSAPAETAGEPDVALELPDVVALQPADGAVQVDCHESDADRLHAPNDGDPIVTVDGALGDAGIIGELNCST